ncbi:hypothetical protein [Mesorhizobium sp. WSM2561]|uniref:hypothetical protein n=1 Tax=Mesorhizobium sp. WSM2561 TaxID=1040985 RepID=UPI0004B26AD7|nr:hypothetical protein [Mesorhizobium sp. WSM2561]
MSAFWQEHRLKKVSKGSNLLVAVKVRFPRANSKPGMSSASDLGPTGLNVRYRSSDAKSRHSASGGELVMTVRHAIEGAAGFGQILGQNL